MLVLVIRHGRAEEGRLLKRDAQRRLTDDGRKDMRKAAKGLKALVPQLDVLATSPLVRAHETAEIVAEVFGAPAPTILKCLAPGSSAAAVLDWLTDQSPHDTVALIGHEPDLSNWVGYALTGRVHSLIELKKGAACLVEFAHSPRAGEGRLLWALTPKQLRRLGD
jgi:phosphohistidine phosphatase